MKPLDIVVCLKSVPDPRRSGAVVLDPRTLTLHKGGVPRVISPLDKNALEEALRIKEERGGLVRVVSMGSPTALDNLREALALGADEVHFLSDPACAGADTLATARALAAVIRNLGRFDLILCGARSFYGSTGQVGPQLAQMLGIGHIGQVASLQLIAGDIVRAESRLEGASVTFQGQLPLLVSVTKEINSPRGISLPGILAARSKLLRTVTCAQLGLADDDVGLAGSATRMIRVTTPASSRGGRMLGGTAGDAVAALVGELRRAGVLAGARRDGQ